MTKMTKNDQKDQKMTKNDCTNYRLREPLLPPTSIANHVTSFVDAVFLYSEKEICISEMLEI